jgi:hypothetical protein
MNTITSPNMTLILPVPGVDPGPDYGNNQNASFLKIDSHNHTTGQGVQIPPQGLNINSNLTFQNNGATNLSLASFISGSAATTTIQALSVAAASAINELWYTDSNGVSTQITKNGVVNATATSIPGQSYASGTFTWKQGAGSNTPANFDIGSIILRPNTALTTNGIEISPPSAIASFYDIVLPALPVSVTSFLTIDTSGNMGATLAVAGALTGTNMASNVNLPGKAVQVNSHNIVSSATNATNGLLIIRGLVSSLGGITSGEGFSVSKTGTGTYSITFDNTFADVPAVTATSTTGSVSMYTLSPTTTGVAIDAFNSGGNVNSGFSFIAIGQST